MREWWIDGVGSNLLKGVAGDLHNPIRLGDTCIIDFLRRLPESRESFNRLFPSLLPLEQARLTVLADAAKFLLPDYKDVEDNIQRSWNTAGVRTAGPRGGTRFGGNQ